jgi:hypothetical protein
VPSPSSLLARLSLVAVLALASAGLAACSKPPPVEHPAALSFRPAKAGSQLWLATPFAVEVVSERDARMLESADPMYVGEIRVAGHMPPSQAALVALIVAEQGATHYRLVSDGDDLRLDIVMYRLERERWFALPEELRPAAPAGTVIAGESSVSL